MSWEMRGQWGPYYTRSRRQHGRVKRDYMGSGEAGQICAVLDAEERSEREAEASAWREQKERDSNLDQMIADIVKVTDGLTVVALVDAGYYQHHRTWRRRRGGD